jgi:hypothetical protein
MGVKENPLGRVVEAERFADGVGVMMSLAE